ncbi:MAG: YkuS family protein [Clostridiales bacterium]|jgi:hypothetical protein|nr:YkuS family protein [Clostridiales bacterium]
MERKIAVEDGLAPVKEFLRNKGYQVVGMQSGQQVDGAVVSGMDNNMMDIQNVVIDAPVVNARGKTPQDILQELESKWLH